MFPVSLRRCTTGFDPNPCYFYITVIVFSHNCYCSTLGFLFSRWLRLHLSVLYYYYVCTDSPNIWGSHLQCLDKMLICYTRVTVILF